MTVKRQTTTVGELIHRLHEYPLGAEVWIQADTVRNPDATPIYFSVEWYPEPESVPAMVLLAGLPYQDD